MKRILIIFIVLVMPVFCGLLEAQEIIITIEGDLFLCDIVGTSEDSISYSFSLDDQIYYETLPTSLVAYHGKNLFAEDKDNSDHEYQQDLIVTKKGEIVSCKILSHIASSSIEYAFLMNEQELKNLIKKKDVAFYAKSYRQQVDLGTESQRFYRALLKTAEHKGFLSGLYDQPPREDSIRYNEDLIVTVNGEEFACFVDEIDANTVRYAFYMNNSIMENSVSRAEVNYLIKDYKSESPEKIIITPLPADFTDLIITNKGLPIACFIEHAGNNTIEYYINEDGSPSYQIMRTIDILYYGSNFLEVINPDLLKLEELVQTSYNDLILTKNQDLLLCNIDKEGASSVKYSFELDNNKLTNYISKTDIIYSGKNFVKLQAESKRQEEVNIADAGATSKVFPDEENKNDNRETETKTIDAARDQTAPEVIIVTPALAGETTFEAVSDEVSKLRISGVILDNSPVEKILVNNTETEIGNNGKFSADIVLNSGINPITITATDIYNNTTSIGYSIERNKPVRQPESVAIRDTVPPEISLNNQDINPEDRVVQVRNSQKSFLVSGKATDQTGVYEVLVNGRDAVLSSNGDFNKEVMLKVGENKITLQATDLELNFSTYIFHVFREDAAAQFGQPEITGGNDKYYALIIGISEYNDPMISNLGDHPTKDANRLSELLKDRYMFDEENLTLLLNPTRMEIMKSFDRLSKKITENDNLLIFFAGHGLYDDVTKLGYWLPSDAELEFTANWIYNNVLVANLKRIQSRHTLLISDACFSGSIFKTRSLNFAPVAYQKKYNLRSRKAITSGVLEAVPNESVFFKFLFEKLEANEEKYLSAGELFRSLEFLVSNNSPNSPQYGTIQNVNDEGGDFIFIKRQQAY